MKRRLAAILAADMVFYSSLMERDAESVLSRQKEYRRSLIDPSIKSGGGAVIKTTGDGIRDDRRNFIHPPPTSTGLETRLPGRWMTGLVRDDEWSRKGFRYG